MGRRCPGCGLGHAHCAEAATEADGLSAGDFNREYRGEGFVGPQRCTRAVSNSSADWRRACGMFRYFLASNKPGSKVACALVVLIGRPAVSSAASR